MYINECDSTTVHGIFLNTRSGVLSELQEMIDFAKLAKSAGIAQYVREVFYDSGAYMCSFEFVVEPEDFDPVWLAVEEIARLTIRQFTMPDGVVQHGRRKPKSTPKPFPRRGCTKSSSRKATNQGSGVKMKDDFLLNEIYLLADFRDEMLLVKDYDTAIEAEVKRGELIAVYQEWRRCQGDDAEEV